MNDITVTAAGLADLSVVQQISRETFFETFVAYNAESDMKKYLAENFGDEKMATELSRDDSHFFISWDQGSAVGYLKVNFGDAQTELKAPRSMEIERIYVKADYHGKKVGQILYEKALETARLKSCSFIWLGVWEKNPKAIRFYEKNGFEAFDRHIFRFGDDEQTDIMMRKVLP